MHLGFKICNIPLVISLRSLGNKEEKEETFVLCGVYCSDAMWLGKKPWQNLGGGGG